MKDSNNFVEELKSNPEFYVALILRLREQVATLTLLNIEAEVLLDLERAKTADSKKDSDK